MSAEQDRKLVTFSIEDYLDDNYEFFSTVERWHAKAIEIVTLDLGLEPAEVEELKLLIIEVATRHNSARVDVGRDYNLAATKGEIEAVALRVARSVSDMSYNDYHFLVRMEVNDSGLIVRGADKHMIEDAAVKYHHTAEEEA